MPPTSSLSLNRCLLAAVVQDDLLRVHALLKQGAQPNHPRWAPLALAKSAPVAQELMDHGAKVTGTTHQNPHFHHRSPLHWAAYNGRKDVVKELLDHGADPLAETHKLHFTPLDLAQHHQRTTLRNSSRKLLTSKTLLRSNDTLDQQGESTSSIAETLQGARRLL